MGRIRSIWNPAMYHGWGKRRNYFEGWYYKVVDSTQQYAFAFIPGIALGEDSHAFVQVVDGRNHCVNYHTYQTSEFIVSPNKFHLQLGKSEFSQQFLWLDIDNGVQTLKGALHFKGQKTWPSGFFSPGAMGWFSFVPFMECYHGILSLDHRIEGEMVINGQAIDFTDGRGYMEKDWGRSFPQAWVWMQSNHFRYEGISLTASIAIIPWMGRHFTGFIIGLWHEDRLYRFTTYLNAKVTVFDINAKQVNFTVEHGPYSLSVGGEMKGGVDLPAPALGAMVSSVKESLSSNLSVSLYHKDELIFDDVGESAGLEIAGDLKRLRSSFKF